MANRKAYWAIFGAALLAGCQSAQDLRSGAPSLDVTVDAAPDKLAGCIGDKLEAWAGKNQGTLSSRPTSNGYSLTVNTMVYSGNDVVILVDIAKQGGKSKVTMFTHFFIGGQSVPSIIRDCLA